MIVFATNFRLIISDFCGALMERYTCGSQKPMPQGLRVRISRALPYKGVDIFLIRSPKFITSDCWNIVEICRNISTMFLNKVYSA